MRRTILFPVLVSVLLTGCGKKIDFGQDEGITKRDERNYLLSTDPTDWTTDGSWNKTERALFHLDPAVDLNGPQQGGVSNLSFYPNPVSSTYRSGIFDFLTAKADMELKLIFVDRKYKVVQEQDMQIPKGSSLRYAFDLKADKFEAGTTYRLYYVYYGSGGTLYCKGHGDVRIAD